MEIDKLILNFVGRLSVALASLWMTHDPWKDHGQVTWHNHTA